MNMGKKGGGGGKASKKYNFYNENERQKISTSEDLAERARFVSINQGGRGRREGSNRGRRRIA